MNTGFMGGVSAQTWRTVGMVFGGAVVLGAVVLAVYYGVPAMSGTAPAQFWANVFGMSTVSAERDPVISKDGKTTSTAQADDAMPSQQSVQLQQADVSQTSMTGPVPLSMEELQKAAALVGTDVDPSCNQRVILNVGTPNVQQLTNLLIQSNGGQPIDQGDFSKYPSGSADTTIHPPKQVSQAYTIRGGTQQVTF